MYESMTGVPNKKKNTKTRAVGVGGCRVWERGENRETAMILDYKTFRLITRGLYGRGRR